MKPQNRIFYISATLLVMLAAGIIFWWAYSSPPQPETVGYDIGFGSDTVKARVLDILETGSITLGEHTQEYLILLVKISEGPVKGQLVEIDYGKRQIRPP